MFYSIYICTIERICLTLPLPNFWYPHPLPGGGGGGRRADPSPAISETVAPMNMKFCRVLETPLKVLETLHSVYLVTIATPQRRDVLGENH